jgi:hypothetical protein
MTKRDLNLLPPVALVKLTFYRSGSRHGYYRSKDDTWKGDVICRVCEVNAEIRAAAKLYGPVRVVYSKLP